MNHLQPSQDKQPIQAEMIGDNNFDHKSKQEQGSSSVEKEPVRKISWGERKTDDTTTKNP